MKGAEEEAKLVLPDEPFLGRYSARKRAFDQRKAQHSDSPRERLAREGVRVLSNRELVSLILREGARSRPVQHLAEGVLREMDGLEGLAESTIHQLERVPGLGPAKAASLVSVFELGRRSAAKSLLRGSCVRNPIDVHRHFSERLGVEKRESFWVLLLDARHRLMSEREVSVGTLTASLVHPREVFREAIKAAAAAILLVHNHPSGDPSPSEEDRQVTERLATAGRLLGISVVDHVIVSAGGHFSFREAGLSLGAEGPGESSF